MRRRGERGAVLVVVAALLLVLVGALLGLVDLGLALEGRARLAHAAEEAALAGAAALCDGDAAGQARALAAENASGLGRVEVAVEIGAEPASALRVVAAASVPALTLGGERRVSASAVATLRRFGVLSLAPGGEIRLYGLAGFGARYREGEIHANGDVRLAGAPGFEAAPLSAGGEVLEGVGALPNPWAGARPAGLPGATSGAPPIGVRPVDDTLLEEWRARADVVFGAGSAPGALLYGIGPAIVTRNAPAIGSERFGATYFFDLTDLSSLGGERPVLFFDAPETLGAERVAVALQPRNETLGHGSPNGPLGATRSLVFVSTVPVIITAAKAFLPPEADAFGGEGEDAVTVIGASDVWIRPSRIDFAGAVVRAGGDIDLDASGFSPRTAQRVRLVADGDVQVVDATGDYELGSSPPCPPALPHLAAGPLDRD